MNKIVDFIGMPITDAPLLIKKNKISNVSTRKSEKIKVEKLIGINNVEKKTYPDSFLTGIKVKYLKD